MNFPWKEASNIAINLCGKVLGGPSFATSSILAATFSTLAVLVKLVDEGLASDLQEIADDCKRKVTASADRDVAIARKVVAEATQLENQAIRAKRSERVGAIEKRQKLAEIAKTEAETKAILMAAEADRAKKIAEATAELVGAIQSLRQKDGSLALDVTAIRALVQGEEQDKMILALLDGFAPESPRTKAQPEIAFDPAVTASTSDLPVAAYGVNVIQEPGATDTTESFQDPHQGGPPQFFT